VITLRELLEDKVYREFFTTMPQMPRNLHPDAMPWRVYVQRKMDGPWGKREFHTYKEAFKFLKPHIKTTYNAAIQSKGIQFEAPFKVYRLVKGGKPLLDANGKQRYRRVVWVPQLDLTDAPHLWCPYCRRPTVFSWFSKHHAFPKGSVFDLSLRRCAICGASERLAGYTHV